MFESRIFAGAREKLPFSEKLLREHFLMVLMIWKVMQRNVWKDIANWQTKQLSSYTKSQHHALTATNSRKKKWHLFENCQQFARRLF